MYTRPSRSAFHPQEVALFNPKEQCERMKKGEVGPHIQENTEVMKYMQYLRDLVLAERRCNTSKSLATYR